MTGQPPSREPTVSRPTISPHSTTTSGDQRILLTTSHLVRAVETTVGITLDDQTIDNLLLELDQQGYVEWVALTSDGEYLWDLTESPDKLGEAVADAVNARIQSWLAAQ